jgi:hypothetical protein
LICRRASQEDGQILQIWKVRDVSTAGRVDQRPASGQHGPVALAMLEADYVVVGVGAMGMA